MNVPANIASAPYAEPVETSCTAQEAGCCVSLPHDLPIFLVGMMGAGKTTIGRGIARALGREFIDLDHELEARCGVRVPVIFEIEGEAGFRRREAACLDECTRQRAVVLATGGGAILADENRRLLRERGIVIYLRASLDELFRRTSRDRNRPLLANPDPRGTLRDLMAHAVVRRSGRSGDRYGYDAGPSLGEIDFAFAASLREDDMTVVDVDTPGGRYPIHIGSGRLDALDQSIPADATAIAVVTNPTVAALYGDRVEAVLARTGRRVLRIELPDGEAHKDWQTLNQIFDALLTHRLDRRAVLVALGGGVIGDMTGFAAAVYMRGIRFVQVPTTLLAQVDSSVGGKTAVNHPLGKNMIGSFYQPIAVEIDTDVLKTLPAREVSAGLAEVIKYGLILDADFWRWCEDNAAALRALDPAALTYAIQRSCELKAEVVGKDERESGLRAILNLGHTFGHAIEGGLGYGQWLHGEAVGCGMVQAAELSADVLGFAQADVGRVRALVEAIGCPVVAPDLGTDRWMSLMQVDKKTEGGEIRFVLMPRIGEAVTRPAPAEAVHRVLARTTS
jgi:3-dehydroquinate synthase